SPRRAWRCSTRSAPACVRPSRSITWYAGNRCRTDRPGRTVHKGRRSARNDRKSDPGPRVDGLLLYLQVGALGTGPTGARVAVEPWEVRAGDLYPDAMPGLEDLAGRDEVDLVLGGHPRLGRDPDDAVDDAHRPAVRPHIDQLRGPIGAHRGRACPHR